MKKIFYIILLSFFLFLSSVAGLEILSRYYKCPGLQKSPANICFSGDYYFLPPTVPPELEEIKARRLANERISKEEYRKLSDKFVLEVSPEQIAGLNGIACGEIGYVRSDLPEEAKKFVKRHELEHLISTGKDKNGEFSANIAAAKEYPLGLIETIIFSVKKSAKYYDNPLCYLVSLWKIFKIYFLP